MWRDYPLSVFAFEEPNAYREEIGRRLVWSDAQVARAFEDEDAERLAEMKAYRARLRVLLTWPGYGLAPEIPLPPGYRAPAFPPEPVIQEPERRRDDLLDFDAEPELPLEMTGDELLNAFEKDEGAAAVLIQTLSALRQKHISEQLNVERARLDREHQATGVANPRSAQIDRLLGLLTRRGEV